MLFKWEKGKNRRETRSCGLENEQGHEPNERPALESNPWSLIGFALNSLRRMIGFYMIKSDSMHKRIRYAT